MRAYTLAEAHELLRLLGGDGGRAAAPSTSQIDPYLAERRNLNAADVIREVAQHYGLRRAQIMGKRCLAPLGEARAVIARILRTSMLMSYPEIAKAMGWLNHTSAMAADRRAPGGVAAKLATQLALAFTTPAEAKKWG